MSEEEAAGLFQSIAAQLREAGFSWVVDQVREELARGRTFHEKVAIAVSYDGLSRDREALSTPPKRSPTRKETFVRTVPYSRREELRLLLAGLERACVQSFDMEAEVWTMFGAGNTTGVRFISDERETVEAIELGNNLALRRAAVEKLRALVGELRVEIDAN